MLGDTDIYTAAMEKDKQLVLQELNRMYDRYKYKMNSRTVSNVAWSYCYYYSFWVVYDWIFEQFAPIVEGHVVTLEEYQKGTYRIKGDTKWTKVK